MGFYFGVFQQLYATACRTCRNIGKLYKRSGIVVRRSVFLQVICLNPKFNRLRSFDCIINTVCFIQIDCESRTVAVKSGAAALNTPAVIILPIAVRVVNIKSSVRTGQSFVGISVPPLTVIIGGKPAVKKIRTFRLSFYSR